MALTNKLLRSVNSAHFTHAGGGSISTVSRAVALVGFAGIRNMALSPVLLEHMHDKGHANQLKEEFLRALMAGSLAGELCPRGARGRRGLHRRDVPEPRPPAHRVLLPEEARQIRQRRGGERCATPRWPPAQAEAAASIGVLGLSFEDLGLGIAKSWGCPTPCSAACAAPTANCRRRVPDKVPFERLRWLTLAANELTDTLLRTEGDPTARGWRPSPSATRARSASRRARSSRATEQARHRPRRRPRR